MRSYGRRLDAETGAMEPKVAQAHDYSIVIPLYVLPIGNGRVECIMRKAAEGPAKRIIQLVASYTDAGSDTSVTQVVQCSSELEEIQELYRLERLILAASRAR